MGSGDLWNMLLGSLQATILIYVLDEVPVQIGYNFNLLEWCL